jgi:hypothetical protein|tara:strand:- start:198 stop:674 length:477 start_codon:yes stop_codon:yes gene_type:complete
MSFFGKAKGYAKTGYGKAKTSYSKYKADAPKRRERALQRQKEKLEDLQAQKEQYAVREQISKHKGAIRKESGGGFGGGALPFRLRTSAERDAMGSSYDFGVGSSGLAIRGVEKVAKRRRKKVTKAIKKGRKRATKAAKRVRRRVTRSVGTPRNFWGDF